MNPNFLKPSVPVERVDLNAFECEPSSTHLRVSHHPSQEGVPPANNPLLRGLPAGRGVLRGIAACTTLALLALVALPACSRSDAHEHEHTGHDHAHEHVEAAATYKAGFGVQLSPEAARFVDLAVGDVEARGIPASALLRTIKGDFVFVANGDWFLRTPVTLGVRDGDWIEVRDGLYEGDRVVVRGVRALWLAELQAVNGGVGCADGH